MNKQQQQLLILGVLVVVLGTVIFFQFRPRKKRRRAVVAAATKEIKAAAVSTRNKPQATPARATAQEIKAQKDRSVLDWGIDPFFHVVSSEVYHGSNLLLKGISVRRNTNSYAIINTEIVTVGDYVYGYEVEDIATNKVLLKRGMESFYLVMPEE